MASPITSISGTNADPNLGYGLDDSTTVEPIDPAQVSATGGSTTEPAEPDSGSLWDVLPSLRNLPQNALHQPDPAAPPVKSSVFAVALSGNTLTDSLLGGTKWGDAAPGTGATLTFSFKTSDTITIASGIPGYADAPWYLDDAQKQGVRDALAEWAKVANLTFVEVPDTSEAQSDLRFGGTHNTPPNRAAETTPLTAGSGLENGTIWLGERFLDWSQDTVSGGMAPGGFAFMALMHEIGHILGLKHPHNVSPTNPLLTPISSDTQRETVMSYNLQFSSSPSTPQELDVAAIQYLYGANTQYNTGDTTYQFAADAPVFQTLWDAGGTNTLDASNQAQGVSLNLAGGGSSTIGAPITDDNFRSLGSISSSAYLTIAPGTVIQNAIGSAYSDFISGNSADNEIEGGAGDDSIVGGAGNDRAMYRISEHPETTRLVTDPSAPNYWHVVDADGRPLLDLWHAADGAGFNVRDMRAAEDIPAGQSNLGQDFMTDVETIDWSQPITPQT